MKHIITLQSCSKIFTCLFLSACLLNTFSIQAQKADKIFELLQEGKITKAVEKRNKVYTTDKKSDLILTDICDCVLFNSIGYKGYDPYRAYTLLSATAAHQQNKDVKKFLTKHNTSFETIKKQIEENILSDAKKINTEAAFARAIEACNKCFYLEEAKQLQEDIAYHNVIEKANIESYKYFLTHYPESERVSEITKLVDKIIFSQLDNTIEAYTAFIQQYPQSELVPEAQNRIYQLAYQYATEQDTREAYVNLLQRYPAHPQKTKIQKAIEEIDYKQFSNGITLYTYNKFIADHPNSPYIEKLNQLMARINKSQFHTEAKGLKGYIKATYEKIETKNINGKTNTSNIRNLYNELGQLTLNEQSSGSSTQGKQYYYHPDNTLSSVVIAGGNEKYSYKGILLQKITFINTKKRETTQSTFKYDENSRLTERTDYPAGIKGGIKTQYIYDANDNLISTKSFKVSTPKNTTITTYSNGKKQNETILNGKLKTIHTYSYNSNGDLSKESIDTNGKISTTTYEYTYDPQGNWTTRIQYNDGKIKETIQREIEYYSYK
ncbi:hypothetical protein [Coprobacter sp.]